MSSHSGADIEVVKEQHNTIVYKTIYNDIERSKSSIEKQMNFGEIDTTGYHIKAIPVEYTLSPRALIAKMPYIEGVSGAQISAHGNKATARNLRLSLNNYFINAIANSKEETIDTNIIKTKIESVYDNCNQKHLRKELDKSHQWFNKNLPSKLNIPIGKCHGDLTLSNIIITQNHELYLLDFLDSFLESPLQDAAKVLQDMIYGWSFRHESEALRLRSQLFCESAYPDYINILSRIYNKEMDIFRLLTIIRIAPYISEDDKATKNWFSRTIASILA
jgi:hypothetical protein